MSYCLLMSRIVLLYVCLFCMMAGVLAQDSSICSSWESDDDSANNLDQSIILWEKNERPFIDCALYCGMDSSCRSFFYNPSLNKCLGSQSYKRGFPDNQAVQQGWNYYTRMYNMDELRRDDTCNSIIYENRIICFNRFHTVIALNIQCIAV
ncbi:hypothetical protein ACJMK2_001134 [Sinanodonta woodiana]|uniref:Apple domain-containing protein n=1 Tax=Sinanodonta woodiana TaxID=1069815 RepID=A0ABD3XRA8_SINWO